MRRSFEDLEEISEEEWEHHTFNPRSVLKKKLKPATPPPPIESFSYRPKTIPQNGASSSSLPTTINIDDSDDSDFKQEEIEEEDEVFKPSRPRRNVVRRRFVMEEDSQEHEVFDIRSTGGEGEGEGDGDGDGDVDGVNWAELETEDEDDADVDMEMLTTSKGEMQEREVDLVGKALQKCAKISVALRQELYGSTARDCDRYAEIDASSCRIVTQEDVSSACASKESDFQPILKPYQLVGVNFLLLLHRKKIGGAILADEMGLGKTVQAVTYLKVLEHLHNDPGPHLIVCPASVLENWERELKRWCPSFSVVMYHGANRMTYSRELTSISKAGLPPPFNVLLVCYSLFERHSEQQKEDRKALKRWQWSCVLMDEAHVLKDKNSYRWKNLMLVAQKARQRLMLTGTPLQNDLHELWSLLEFMLPDIFATGDADLRKLFNAEDHDLILHIKSILGPFILRRLKSDVMQQLVPKMQNVKYVFMGSEQSDTYDHAIQDYRAACQARTMKSSNGVCSDLIGLLPKRQISNYFTQFRKIANHPLLIRRLYGDEDVVQIGKMLYPKGAFGFQCTLERAVEEIKSYNDFAIHQLLVSYGDTGTKGALSDEDVLSSAKCQALAELLPQLMNQGHRVLIFSQWTQMLDILEWTLEVIGVTYRRLDGSTQVAERQTIVDTFNNDQSIFACLLSTRAGGQGLNLIGADTVIIHDMDFNPQMDRQAEDRCHRIGQEKPVTIYRLVTKDTVDENIYEIAKRKLVLDAAVLESGGVELDNGNDVPERTMGEILSSLLLF